MFVLAFILAIFAGNLLNFDEQVLAILKNISSIFLVGALFCIGTQINLMSIKVINSRIIIFALLLWLFALSAAYFLIDII